MDDSPIQGQIFGDLVLREVFQQMSLFQDCFNQWAIQELNVDRFNVVFSVFFLSCGLNCLWQIEMSLSKTFIPRYFLKKEIAVPYTSSFPLYHRYSIPSNTRISSLVYCSCASDLSMRPSHTFRRADNLWWCREKLDVASDLHWAISWYSALTFDSTSSTESCKFCIYRFQTLFHFAQVPKLSVEDYLWY